MKKLIYLLLIPVVALLVSSCSDDDPITPAAMEGNLYITSNPAGAQIWIDGVNTSQTTPDTVLDIDEGVHNVTLRLTEYKDTTFSISITADQTSVVGPIALTSDINTTLYGPIRIYETAGTSASEPSGLDLSSGMAYGVSSANNGLVDIYYSSTGFLVQSANLYPGLIRETDFLVGNSGNLFDGVDSPERSTGTWTTGIGDREANYVFLYDHDGNYSKLKIVNWGGGVPGEPAWVDVQWYYNNTQLDERFK
ncbi:MAG: PEGA domain-containing protein [bacterium]|nr:PEGA domain-containing protein [bacterium]